MEKEKIFKNVKISTTLHEKLKKYCNDEGLKLSTWVEKQLNEKMRELCQK